MHGTDEAMTTTGLGRAMAWTLVATVLLSACGGRDEIPAGANFFDDLARKTFGRSPVHVMLLHETDVTAMFLPRLIAALKADGWTMVPVDEAYADPIAGLQPKVPSAQGTIVELAAWQRGVPEPRWYERNNERIVQALFDVRVLGLPTPSVEETE